MGSGSFGAFVTGVVQGLFFVLVAWGVYALAKANRQGKALGITKVFKSVGWLFVLFILGALLFSIYLGVKSA